MSRSRFKSKRSRGILQFNSTSQPTALTRPSSANARRLKSRHPFVFAARHFISSSDNNNLLASQWVDHQWNAEWADKPKRLRIFIPDTGIHPHGMTLPRRALIRLNRLRTGVGRFRSCLYKWDMASSVSVAQKNIPSTMLSSNVQSIDLPMDCMAWRFWTMKQLNGCSTPAPRSSAAEQWFEQLAQKKNRRNCAILLCFVRYIGKENFTKERLCCINLLGHASGSEIFRFFSKYFGEKDIDRGTCVRVCIDGAASMTAYRLGDFPKITNNRLVNFGAFKT